MTFLVRLLVSIFFVTASFVVKADFSPELCDDGLTSRGDFSVYTPIQGYEPRETIYAERDNTNFDPINLWTNDTLVNIAESVTRDDEGLTVDDSSEPESTYHIWLTYEANDPNAGNKQGWLTFYLWEDGSWVEKDSGLADLSDLSKPQLIIGGDENLPLECSDSIDPPEPPPSGGDYYIEYISSSSQIGLTCDAPLGVTFQVYNSDGSTKGDYTGGITVTSSSPTALFNGSDPSGTVYDPNDQGELALTLSDSVVNDVVVTATLDNAQNDSGQYKFVARLFRFAENVNNTSNLVAGLEVENIAIQPLECDEDGNVAISDDYTGMHAVDFSATNYKSPDSANLNRESYVQVNGNSLNSPQTINLDFGTDSTAYIDVRYDEAGIVDYRIEDEICVEADNGEDCVTTTGTHNLNVRPWTFALCNPTGNENSLSGTSESGVLFKRSGELFSLDAIPIRYVSGTIDPSVAVDVSGYCSSSGQGGGLANPDLETKNFYPYRAPAVNVTLEAELHSPSVSLGSEADGTIGTGLEGVPTNGIPNVGIDGNRTSGPVLFESLKWREAGSITATASLKDPAIYLFEPINPGYRSVGRFSPQHLVMLEEDSDWTQWNYAEGHDDFAYMNQAITHSFKVQAQDIDGNPTQNYGLFNNDLISTIDYMAQTEGESPEVDFMDEDALRVEGVQTWAGSSWPKSLANDPSTLSIEIEDFRFMKKVHSTIDSYVVTQPDGPYTTSNSVFGLEVSTIIDDVNFDNLDIEDLNPDDGQDPQESVGRKFPNQPDFRYGRMKMDDVGGNSGQEIRVPLRTEYWDGDGFIVNPDDGSTDNGTPVGSSYVSAGRFCTQVIWSNDNSTSGASLNGSDTVEQGRSEELYATHSKQSETHREQVRLWLRQGETSPQRTESGIDCNTNGGNFTNQPWLQYNWRNKGDEDPSTVVTFGTFRGNDRIIFKGERGLIGN
ncbi:hypothetical protein BCT61_01240 [Vibrio breoganii]|uniref:DUF6701 domain-containing protein n=1 Tax=Vibrio breoganii TaxID=553239 RepID=UPI000C837F80|nr:DUF6701 domain-containing protein [Vibrio breoganii]PMM08482.1 hypothetical protein BCT61_01240 [Vibrio breoganii]